MPIDALSVSCAQLTRDLLAIAKFLFVLTEYTNVTGSRTDRQTPHGGIGRAYAYLGSIAQPKGYVESDRFLSP